MAKSWEASSIICFSGAGGGGGWQRDREKNEVSSSSVSDSV